MPNKLKLVVAVMILGVALSLVSGAWVSALIGGALTFGVLVGNDGVRAFLRGLCVVQILLAAGLTVFPFLLGAASELDGRTMLALAISTVFGIAMPAYMVWALGQEDVRNWMFRKNFKLDDEP